MQSEEFLHNPNLKFKQIITKNNNNSGFNNIFEVYKSLKNNEVYLASPHKTEYNLDIIIIKNCKLLISLKGHNNLINIVKYYINTKNKDEYLISIDKDNSTIIWGINTNYSKIYIINGEKSIGLISDFLFCFININNSPDNYIIFANKYKEYTSIYSLDDKKIKVIESSNKYNTYYLIFWINKKDNNNYIIELSEGSIYINNINNDMLYDNFNLSPFDYYQNNCGFIYTKYNQDYLIVCNSKGDINIWDLENKYLALNICLNNNKNKNSLLYILEWSNKYIIIADYYNRLFNIMDINTSKILTKIKGKHFGGIIYAKKFIHPIYGESLLTSGQDNSIILWSI